MAAVNINSNEPADMGHSYEYEFVTLLILAYTHAVLIIIACLTLTGWFGDSRQSKTSDYCTGA